MPTPTTRSGDPTEGPQAASVKRVGSRGRSADQQAQQHAMVSDESVNTAARHRLIQIAAYYRAQHRDFAAGGALADWLAAEAEVDLSLHR